MKYQNKRFSVGGYDPAFSDNWDRIFGEERLCVVCGERFRAQIADPGEVCGRCLARSASEATGARSL